MFEHELKCRCHTQGLQQSRFFITEAKPHYAPDRFVDVEHIKLELNVDLEAKMVAGICTTDFRVVAPNITTVQFDAVDLVVKQVFDSSGSELVFNQTDKKILVTLRKELNAGDVSQIVIKYVVIEPRAGLYFIAPDENYPKRPWQLWSQGEDQDNRYWIPCHDAPNEKATTEMIVTVAEKYTAISNGKLHDMRHDPRAKTKTFHWKQSIPHASYLITLCVGEFVEIKDSWKNSNGQEVPVSYFTLPSREAETKFCFGKTPKMMSLFSKKIGVDYPYEKYAQVVAYDFIYGGMENTSATTQTEYTLHPESIDKEFSSEPLVAHELAHQWFGDLLTCKEWSHAWLNEGFATYFETIWTENEHGTDEALYELYEYERNYKDEEKSSYRRPVVTNVFLNPSDIFDRHLYEKGARVLHMLRHLVGEELWWKAIGEYVKRYSQKTVETVDLQRVFEEVTGRNLARFFDQWIFKAGHPAVKATYEWVEERKQAKFTISQTQKQNELTSVFQFPLQIRIAHPDGETVHSVLVEDVEHTFSFVCPTKPSFVSINPANTILADWKFEPGRDILLNQIQYDKDVMGRVFAANSLSKDHSRQAVDALGEALGREKFWGVQSEIAKALGAVGSTKAKEYLLRFGLGLEHPKARRAVVKALGLFQSDDIRECLEKLLKTDLSPLVQYEAGISLGKTRTPVVFEKLSTSLKKRDSWHDYYDRGLLQGLAEYKYDDRVLPILIKFTALGHSVFLRREAADALLKYGSARPSVVVETFNELTRDSNFFVRLTAIRALAILGDPSASRPLSRIVDSMVEPRTYRTAVLALKTIREGKTPSEAVEKLKQDFDCLREEYRKLLSRVEKIEDKHQP